MASRCCCIFFELAGGGKGGSAELAAAAAVVVTAVTDAVDGVMADLGNILGVLGLNTILLGCGGRRLTPPITAVDVVFS